LALSRLPPSLYCDGAFSDAKAFTVWALTREVPHSSSAAVEEKVSGRSIGRFRVAPKITHYPYTQR